MASVLTEFAGLRAQEQGPFAAFRQGQQAALERQQTQQAIEAEGLKQQAAQQDIEAQAGLAPLEQQQLEQQVGLEQIQLGEAQRIDLAQSINQGARQALAVEGDPNAQLRVLNQRRNQIIQQQGAEADTSDTDEVIGLIESGRFDDANALLKNAVAVTDPVIQDLGLGIREREAAVKEAGIDIRRDELAQSRAVAQQKAGALSATTQKILDTSQTKAIESGNRSREFDLLASDFEAQTEIPAGVAGTFSERLKELTGDQDAVSSLRRRFNSIRASQSSANLPPGAASEKDVELALSGLPAQNASSEQITGFLRGLAKLERADEAFETFKSRLISEEGNTKGLLTKWKDSPEFSQLEEDFKTGTGLAGAAGAAGAAAGASAAGGPQEGATATNPATGQTLLFTNGRWVPR